VAGTITVVAGSPLGRLPAGVTARHVIGLGLVCGLGFTVALFVTELAFHDPALTDHAKIGILAAAVLCGAAAALVLATGTAHDQPRRRRRWDFPKTTDSHSAQPLT
jgi:NhaA family Na+:H+ antiporter